MRVSIKFSNRGIDRKKMFLYQSIFLFLCLTFTHSIHIESSRIRDARTILLANSHSKLKTKAPSDSTSTLSSSVKKTIPSKTSYPIKPNSIINPSQCAAIPLTLCVGSKETHSMKMFTPDAKMKSLLGWYTFDDAYGYDSSIHDGTPPR
jgi:hypothetical protein